MRNVKHMRRCTYCGKEYDDTATICVIDRQPVSQAPLPADGSSKRSDPSVEFLRLLFKVPREEELAARFAQFLARFIGDRILLLRPDTNWSEIISWYGSGPVHAFYLRRR